MNAVRTNELIESFERNKRILSASGIKVKYDSDSDRTWYELEGTKAPVRSSDISWAVSIILQEHSDDLLMYIKRFYSERQAAASKELLPILDGMIEELSGQGRKE